MQGPRGFLTKQNFLVIGSEMDPIFVFPGAYAYVLSFIQINPVVKFSI